MTPHGRRVLFGVAALAAAPARAQEAGFPARPVRIIVPFAPGGSTDAQVRLVASRLSQTWRQPVVVETRPGAGTTIGATQAAAAAPDGYTLYALPGATHAIAAVVYAPLPYHPLESFAGISLLATQPLVISARPDSEIGSLDALLEAARARPGVLSYASTGTGAGPHLAMEAFKAAARLDILHVPFTGSAPALTAVLARQVDVAITDTSVIPMIRDGQLRGIAVTSAARWPSLPDTPSLVQAGLVAEELIGWVGLFTQAAVPRPIVERLNAGIVAALADAEVVRLIETSGARAAPMNPETAQAWLRREVERYTVLARQLGITRN
jgi:tripartite-type tricarboxylate transporter receptor subunit TctC